MLWKCRKQAFGADRPAEPQLLHAGWRCAAHQIAALCCADLPIGQAHGIRIVNVFHAGDGNIHPILLFDERDAEQVKRVLKASDEILNECIDCGGSVTGEHGIGVEKISFMNRLFTPADLDVMGRLRDAFNPEGRLSPGKMLPTAGACGHEQVNRDAERRCSAGSQSVVVANAFTWKAYSCQPRPITCR